VCLSTTVMPRLPALSPAHVAEAQRRVHVDAEPEAWELVSPGASPRGTPRQESLSIFATPGYAMCKDTEDDAASTATDVSPNCIIANLSDEDESSSSCSEEAALPISPHAASCLVKNTFIHIASESILPRGSAVRRAQSEPRRISFSSDAAEAASPALLRRPRALTSIITEVEPTLLLDGAMVPEKQKPREPAKSWADLSEEEEEESSEEDQQVDTDRQNLKLSKEAITQCDRGARWNRPSERADYLAKGWGSSWSRQGRQGGQNRNRGCAASSLNLRWAQQQASWGQDWSTW